MRYHFTFSLTERDFFEFNKYHLYHTPASKRWLILARFAGSVIFFTLAFSLGAIRGHRVSVYALFCALGLVWLASYPQLVDLGIMRRIKRLNKRGRLLCQREIIFRFENDGFIETTPDKDAKFRYAVIERVAAGGGGVYLYIGASLAHVLPNHAFANTAQRGAFLLFIQTKTARQC
jgi:hypothetical protein